MLFLGIFKCITFNIGNLLGAINQVGIMAKESILMIDLVDR